LHFCNTRREPILVIPHATRGYCRIVGNSGGFVPGEWAQQVKAGATTSQREKLDHLTPQAQGEMRLLSAGAR
jgi:hypothetical protein